jgi:tetratricopeptide (TPR) repeat protein
MRRSGVEAVGQSSRASGAWRRPLALVVAALAIAAIGYGGYRLQTVALEESVPRRPLSARELAAYLERDQIEAGPYESMFALPDEVEEWPEAPAELARALHQESSRWSLEQVLGREVLTADQALGKMATATERVKLYPLELATSMTALLRGRGVEAMVAEAWDLGGDKSPADPSGMLGYYLTAVYESSANEPSRFFDPWGGRGEVSPSSFRVLRDTEVVAAALGIEAARVFTRSGDSAKALPMIGAALRLDPVSPSLRVVYATVLVESGGLPQALEELNAATQLRSDGPRKLHAVQLNLAHAAMLEAGGELGAAEAKLSEANRIVADVIDTWPRYGRAHLTLATVYLGLGDYERARVELETAEALSPDSPMLWAVWAQLHLASDDPTSAAAKMRRALRLDPENWQLRAQAASVFQAAGDEAAARAEADEALQLVAPDRRSKLEAYLDRVLGPAMPEVPEVPELPIEEPAALDGSDSGDGPALMLGDPSDLRLRDPDQTLKLDLDE